MAKEHPSKESSILDAAAVVLAQNPGASMSVIAKQAGIGRATLHRYYPKREDLLRALALNALAKSDEAVMPLYQANKPKSEMLKDIIHAMVPMGAYWHFLSFEYSLMEDETVKEKYDVQLKRLSQLVNEVKAEQGLAADIPTAWVSTAVDALIYAAWMSIESGAVARNDAADLVVRTIFKGLA